MIQQAQLASIQQEQLVTAQQIQPIFVAPLVSSGVRVATGGVYPRVVSLPSGWVHPIVKPGATVMPGVGPYIIAGQ
jgi:hypothetical protein